MPFGRWAETTWRRSFSHPYVQVIFGARQVGKSTLLAELVPEASIRLDFSHPGERTRYLKDPGRLVSECRALPLARHPLAIVVDEAQNVPAVFDAVQHLYDSDRERWRFYLCGSSARKLRTTGANLLPGRSLVHHLYPLVLGERPAPHQGGVPGRVLALDPDRGKGSRHRFPEADLLERLVYGELPGIITAPESVRDELLQAYCHAYLEEELRREAMVKDWGAFARFLTLAAAESGQMINYARIAREAGISLPTVKAHYQLMEDMFIGTRVAAFSSSIRKSLLSTDRFLFFDLGVRHAAAGLEVSRATVLADPGPIFEQWVGLELWKRLGYLRRGRLLYYRTKGGAEIDYILDTGDEWIPVEVKWTENPSPHDARPLETFLDDHKARGRRGFLVSRCVRPRQLSERVTALPWWMI